MAAMVIDVDTHITEPPDTWTSRTGSKWGDAIPRIENVGGFNTWVLNGKPCSKPGNTAVAGICARRFSAELRHGSTRSSSR